MTDHTGFEYAELHCHTHYSFLDGAASPAELVEEAVRLGLSGMAVTDHDGMYGVVQFAEAARGTGLPTVFGSELSFDLPARQSGVADPAGRHLLVLARDPEGYARLSTAITEAYRLGEKGRPVYDLDALGAASGGHWLVLTGCRKGFLPAALGSGGEASAGTELDRLIALFGRGNVAVELIHHDLPGDDERLDALAGLAARYRVPTVATNNVHYASPSRQPVAATLAAIRARRTLDRVDGYLPAAASAHLRGAGEMLARFGEHREAVANAAAFAAECAFSLDLIAPRLPHFAPGGHTEMSWLRHRVEEGARLRYGHRDNPRSARAYAVIDKELAVIDDMGFPGYFLIVDDIAAFCRKNGIYCQGRGSAANSAVCYALGITNVDAVEYGLLFERFLSPARDGHPDIDVDIESDRREEVIQYVYGHYGRDHAAMVANVISYRPRSAVRDVAKALGHSPETAEGWSKQLDRYGGAAENEAEGLPDDVAELADRIRRFPRHLGIHPGGMVICDRPIAQVCPVEPATMPNRTVLQWDKDDCASAGLVKFDLLGLGMLTALRKCVELIAAHHGVHVDLARLPKDDPATFAMLRAADTVGVFQVESRAQMSTLPRLKPENFYDLAIEVALIRPGPIQGGSVHPYLERRERMRAGHDPRDVWKRATHPKLHDTLGKTLGVPLFQEQLMQIAIDIAGFDAGQADELRRAMGSKRSEERMLALKARLYAGMSANGVTDAQADEIYQRLKAFSDFGFPESHAISFAHIVYSSAWLKRHFPAAFTASLLNSQPMGFYSPNSLIADARRHGITVLRPDVNLSDADASLEDVPGQEEPSFDPAGSLAEITARPVPQPAIRLGLSAVRSIGGDLAGRIAAGQPYDGPAGLARRAGPSTAQMEALAVAGAFACFGLGRREALWAAGAAAREREDTLPGVSTGLVAPPLPVMTQVELAGADFWATGVSPDDHPVAFARADLDARGVVRVADAPAVADGTRVRVAGLITHRQRPATAGGVTFLSLEDETGILNVVCSPGLWARQRTLARTAVAVVVRGRVEKKRTGRVEGDDAEGVVTNLVADLLEELPLSLRPGPSRDFR
ncbi:error-prone DNA polymerase [Actinorhabdospora filicis]|uniref:Error-prone DNA polymerase n=1 Tax=Actinorhabdospora filicis TaxID=1785913 RepID=A0A9W6SDW6_9ACTN|nr:error-prone DNA polymerase [Actinorhabdospora filicis]